MALHSGLMKEQPLRFRGQSSSLSAFTGRIHWNDVGWQHTYSCSASDSASGTKRHGAKDYGMKRPTTIFMMGWEFLGNVQMHKGLRTMDSVGVMGSNKS